MDLFVDLTETAAVVYRSVVALLGASGSPIFRRDDPGVLGMLDAAFEGEARLTYALPGHLLQWATKAALADGTLSVNGIPSLNEYQARGHALGAWHSPERS